MTFCVTNLITMVGEDQEIKELKSKKRMRKEKHDIGGS
jgi:hypothetical protein